MVASPGMHPQIALDAVQLAVNGVRSAHVAGLAASLRWVGYDTILAAGSLPENGVTRLRHNLQTCRGEVWQELHVRPRLAPSANARLCTYFRWFQPFAQAATNLRLPISHGDAAVAFSQKLGAMVLQWTWAGAVALLEQNGLALCVGLALEMRCTLCFECAALQVLRDDMPTLFQGVRSMRCFCVAGTSWCSCQDLCVML